MTACYSELSTDVLDAESAYSERSTGDNRGGTEEKMLRTVLLGVVLLSLLVFLPNLHASPFRALTVSAPLAVAPSRSVMTTCDDFGKIKYPRNFGVENDNWGSYTAGFTETTDSCVWTNPDKFGWYWNANAQQPHPDYPEIVFGKLYWIESFSIAPWPFPVAQLKQLLSYASVAQQTSGMWDLTYDIWITDDRNAASKKDHMTHEIMIFLNWSGFSDEPCSSAGETFSDGYNTYAYCYKLSSSGWYRHTVALQAKGNSATIDILRILQFIQKKGFSLKYIFTIEFGNEFWFGAGDVTVTSYSITLNGKTYQ